jgi:hypothetical protein
MLEIHGDAVADHRLDLPKAPVGPARMAHEIAGRQRGCEAGFTHRVGKFCLMQRRRKIRAFA